MHDDIGSFDVPSSWVGWAAWVHEEYSSLNRDHGHMCMGKQDSINLVFSSMVIKPLKPSLDSKFVTMEKEYSLVSNLQHVRFLVVCGPVTISLYDSSRDL